MIDRNVKEGGKIFFATIIGTIIACDDDSVVASATLYKPKPCARATPFALVEYVVTHLIIGGKDCKTLNKALDIAQENNCYKIMLVTGQSDERVHNLYQMGYKSQGKQHMLKS